MAITDLHTPFIVLRPGPLCQVHFGKRGVLRRNTMAAMAIIARAVVYPSGAALEQSFAWICLSKLNSYLSGRAGVHGVLDTFHFCNSVGQIEQSFCGASAG